MTEKRANVLVTTAGAVGTAGKILGLRQHGHRVVATDCDPRSAGLYLADAAFTVPGGTSPAFLGRMRRICASENIQAIVPLVDEELLPVWELAAEGVEILLPHAEMVALCLDKLVLMETLAEAKVTVPHTRLATFGAGSLAYPLIVKPRAGRGGRGIAIARNRRELRDILARAGDLGQWIIQEYVEGPEFSVSVVAWRDGQVQAVVPKEVVLKEGSSRYAISRRNPAITEICIETAHALDADGPFNVQLRLDSLGAPQVFEINPRFSGSSALTTAAGIDEINGLLAQALDTHQPPVTDNWQENVAMIRHPIETFVPADEFVARRNALEAAH
ncbi:ATP-grasp domain-containing protein [Allosalinactinospora lopnorensis]|uniref:ATP-grasp domain-containing protein n=1 Tax=Allosalinactinospora lopnorensis TaxID=1352348 RepID=UPI00069836F6|nr:ATP-grasp domain-containing protein [Allosalinactinospora lopnorensis]